MIKKYDVNIIINRGVYSDYATAFGNTLHCGCMSEIEIGRLLQKIAKWKMLPATSCINHINAHFKVATTKHVLLSQYRPTTNYPIEKLVGGLDIFILTKHDCKCPKTDCVCNIASGKCTDKILIEILGKQFFPEQYKKTKQR